MQTRSSDENSVRSSNAWILTKRKKDLSGFLYHTKDHLAVSQKKNGWWGDIFYLKLLVNRPQKQAEMALQRNKEIRDAYSHMLPDFGTIVDFTRFYWLG